MFLSMCLIKDLKRVDICRFFALVSPEESRATSSVLFSTSIISSSPFCCFKMSIPFPYLCSSVGVRVCMIDCVFER